MNKLYNIWDILEKSILWALVNGDKFNEEYFMIIDHHILTKRIMNFQYILVLSIDSTKIRNEKKKSNGKEQTWLVRATLHDTNTYKDISLTKTSYRCAFVCVCFYVLFLFSLLSFSVWIFCKSDTSQIRQNVYTKSITSVAVNL